jgi:hypothetical protein
MRERDFLTVFSSKTRDVKESDGIFELNEKI